MEQVTDEQLFAAARSRGELDRNHREAHGGQHALPLDRLPDHRRREAGPESRQRIRRPARHAQRLAGGVGRRLDRVFAALEPLTDADLGRTVTIRGEAHSVMQAINRQLAHYANHVGQIVMLAKHFARTTGSRSACRATNRPSSIAKSPRANRAKDSLAIASDFLRGSNEPCRYAFLLLLYPGGNASKLRFPQEKRKLAQPQQGL